MDEDKKFLTPGQVGEKLLSSVSYSIQSLFLVEDSGVETLCFTSEDRALRWKEAKTKQGFIRRILAVCYYHPHNKEDPVAYVELPDHYSKVVYCLPDLKFKAETMLRIPEKDLKALRVI